LLYFNFNVVSVDIAEFVIMTETSETYNVRVYNKKESSLYELIQDVTNAVKNKDHKVKKEKNYVPTWWDKLLLALVHC